MAAKIDPKPAPTDNGSGDYEIFHVTCCDDDIALCGIDVTTYPEVTGEGEQKCVVCEDLYANNIPCRPDCKF